MSKELGKVKVHVTWDAYNKMLALVKKFSFEVSWIMSVKPNGDNSLLIDNVFVIEQVGTGATTRFDQGAFDNFCMNVGMGEVPGVALGDLRGWGHSHVNMAAFESGEDVDTSRRTFGSESSGFIISLVLNKRNEYYLAVYLFSPFMCTLPGELIVDYPSTVDMEAFMTDAEAKVKSRSVVTFSTHSDGARTYRASDAIADETGFLFPESGRGGGGHRYKSEKGDKWSKGTMSFKDMETFERQMRDLEFTEDPAQVREMMDYYDNLYPDPREAKNKFKKGSIKK